MAKRKLLSRHVHMTQAGPGMTVQQPMGDLDDRLGSAELQLAYRMQARRIQRKHYCCPILPFPNIIFPGTPAFVFLQLLCWVMAAISDHHWVLRIESLTISTDKQETDAF